MLELGAKKLRERLYTPVAELAEGVERPALKQILINKCPVIAPTSTLTGEAAKRLNIDLMNCQKNRQLLLASRKEIQQKINKIFEPQKFEPVTDPDLMIYAGGFFHDKDKAVMKKIHATDPESLAEQTWSFEDKRLPEMLFRYRARNYPETLNEQEQAEWVEHCRARLIEGNGGHLSFTAFYAEIAEIRADASIADDKKKILNEVEAFAKELREYMQ